MNTNLKPVIVFDFGNVLIQWQPNLIYRDLLGGNPAAVDKFLEDIHFHEWNIELDRGRPFSEVIPEVCLRFPQQAELIRAYDERYEESLVPMQPTIDILLELKRLGYTLFGLSNWSAEKFSVVRQKYSFFNCFEGIVISGEERVIKPDPRIYEILLERIGRPAGVCLFIDDNLENIKAAGRLGFQTIQFKSAEQLRSDLERLDLFD